MKPIIIKNTVVAFLAMIMTLALAPAAQAQDYPLSRYELDQHVDAGLTNLSGTIDAIPHALAAIIWSLDRHAAGWVIGLFGAAFNVTLLSSGTPLAGAVSRAAHQLFTGFAQPMMFTMIILAGLWAMWEMLIMRRYSNGAAKLAISLAYCIVAMAIVMAPGQTIGVAAEASHEMSQAALAAVLPGQASGAALSATEGLRASLINEPWILLDFGAGLHCVDNHGSSADPTAYRASGAAIPPPGGKCLDSHSLAPTFLHHDSGTDERNQAFDQLKSGTQLQRAAVHIQTGGAGYDRVALAIGLFIASLGALILVGGLALGMIASQLYALLLCACAPIALMAALVPGSGHHIFEVWIRQLIEAVFRSAVYCVYLSVAVALSIALAKAAPAIGQISALTLQAILWWGLVIYGKRLSERLAERAIATPAATMAAGAASRVAHALPTPTRSASHTEASA